MEVTATFTEDELLALRGPIETARALPNRAYVDAGWYAAELAQVFARRWVAATFAHRLPGPGSVVPVAIAGQPVVVVHGDDDQLRGFYNVCEYDSCEVVVEPASGLERLQGPYHGWEWDLRGRLQAIPYWDGTPAPALSVLPRSGDLVEIPTERWLDLVFVCLDQQAPPFAEFIAPLEERLAGVDLSSFSVTRGPDGLPDISAGTIPANWKIAFENDVELLYEAFVHEEYRASPFSPKVDASTTMTCEAVADRGLFGLAAPIAEYFDATDAPLPVIPVSGKPHMETFQIFDLYPNVQIGIGADHFTLGIYTHDQPNATENEVAFYVHESVASDATVASLVAAPWDHARKEDNVVCAATQRGRRSRVHQSAYYSPFWDELVHCFHQHLAHDLCDTSPEVLPR